MISKFASKFDFYFVLVLHCILCLNNWFQKGVGIWVFLETMLTTLMSWLIWFFLFVTYYTVGLFYVNIIDSRYGLVSGHFLKQCWHHSCPVYSFPYWIEPVVVLPGNIYKKIFCLLIVWFLIELMLHSYYMGVNRNFFFILCRSDLEKSWKITWKVMENDWKSHGKVIEFHSWKSVWTMWLCQSEDTSCKF